MTGPDPKPQPQNGTGRLGFVHATLALFAVAILVKAGVVQVGDRDQWKQKADVQHTTTRAIPAPRGDIYDVDGKILAQNIAMVSLAVAPRELREPAKVIANLRDVGVPDRVLARLRDTSQKWVVIPGNFLAVKVAAAVQDRGVYSTPAAARDYSVSEGSRGIIGRVDGGNTPREGLELALDEWLRGKDGEQQFFRDGRRNTFDAPTASVRPSIKGHSVSLTLNHQLQEIVENALVAAVAKTGATGGDIVVLDPHNGEIRAMASQRASGSGTPSALTEPFEPGSTLKPFIAAGLIDRGRVSDADSVDTGNGKLELNGRVIEDDHKLEHPAIGLGDVIRWSSNIGIVKFAERLAPREEFETLRDFGFGTPTGVVFPSEAAGRLPSPKTWSLQSPASLAMGYEMSATPLQLAVAYAAFANGGELLEPALVKEIRAPDGSVIYRHQRRVVRRVVSRETAEKVRAMLVDVVAGGTAKQADVSTYLLAGKTGTPRATVGGRYLSGHYNPNFAGLFPADAPQFVIVVKLSDPDPAKSIYGGQTAAPLTKTIVEAALAAKGAALDLGKLASSVRSEPEPKPAADQPTSVTLPGAQQAQAVVSDAASDAGLGVAATTQHSCAAGVRVLPIGATMAEDGRVVVRLSPASSDSAVSSSDREVPDVAGLALRDAVRELHCAGFRVQLVPAPASAAPRVVVRGTAPLAGARVPAGTLIRLTTGQ